MGYSGWRTSAYHAGHHNHGALSEEFQKELAEPHGMTIETGTPPERCDHPRYCPECGKEVCTYKDAHMDIVWCYAHDDLTPWTRPYLVGKTHARSPQRGTIRVTEGASFG